MTAAGAQARYQPLSPERPESLEDELLARWREEELFRRALAARADGPPWVFFEGPPTANGRPGIHHVFARTVKDLFCRHRAMRGHYVLRKAGWDTHGLPVEIEVEKQLGISGKPEIERLGVAEFNRQCRESVWRYRADWERLSERIGYWLDYAHPYVTYSSAYIESVWWALATLYERELLYRGHKVLPYCPRCGTALSSHEVALGYAEVPDPSVYVALRLGDGAARDGAAGSGARRILVWTTTPWTLVSNTALAVHPDLTYVELREIDGPADTLILAEARAAAVLGADYEARWHVVQRVPGLELAGLAYRRPLDWVEFAPHGGAHEVIVAESFVSAEEGTGVVHMSPAFGADDYAAGQRHALAFVQPVDGRGRFPAGMPVVAGRFFKDADPLIIEELRRRGALWRAETITHPYPHCWRCTTPLLYYARSSWFVRTTAYRDAMLERNARVRWQPPEVGSGRFGEWLTNNIDWAISRDRYWGTPLPLWVCERDASHVEAIGSFAALAERAGTALAAEFDPHKPFIDGYSWPCARCAAAGHPGHPGDPGDGVPRMRRVPEVIDTWFDSGSMPFAQWHYPFEGRDVLPSQYPADFIAEGVDQTRGWFYSLLAIATGLGDALPNNVVLPSRDETAPYRAVVVNDLVLDADGAKMSKSRGNIVDPWAVIARHGADAVRLFLVASSQVWVPRRFDEAAIRETAGKFLVTLRNVYGFFALYANFGWTPSGLDPAVNDRPPIDRWVLSRLAAVEREADELLGAFEATEAARVVMSFVTDDVSNWYVRLTRDRFYDVDEPDSRAAFATLHEVLAVVTRLLAPIAPFVTDWIHRELTGESVHLAPYTRDPSATASHADPVLEAAMGEARALVTLGRAAREAAGVKVRQPLPELVGVVPDAAIRLDDVLPLVRDELNVKRVTLVTGADELVTLEARPNFRTLGKRFGKRTPAAAAAVAALAPAALRQIERGERAAIVLDGEAHEVTPDEVSIVRRARGAFVVQEAGGRFAAIDPTVTPALRAEGLARELVSRIQRLRKDAGFAVSDRIHAWIDGDETVRGAVRTHRDWIASEILALSVTIGTTLSHHHASHVLDLDGIEARVAITRDT